LAERLIIREMATGSLMLIVVLIITRYILIGMKEKTLKTIEKGLTYGAEGIIQQRGLPG